MLKPIIIFLVMLISLSPAGAAVAKEAAPLPLGVVIVKIGSGAYASGVAIQKDGKILISASAFRENQGQAILARRNADGSPDQTFGKAGIAVAGLPGHYIRSDGMVLQEDGKAVLAGVAIPLTRDKWSGSSNDDFLVIRYNPDGQMDRGFNGSGLVQTDIDGDIDVVYGLALQKDRKIVVIGNTSKWRGYHFATLRYNEDGQLDRGFGKRGKVVTRVGSAREDHSCAIAVQPDGKIIVAGGGDDYPQYGRVMALVRYKPDGGLDPRFGLKGKILRHFGNRKDRNDSIANALAVQPDGKIVVGVDVFTRDERGVYWREGRLVRLNSDGGLDGRFGSVIVNSRGYQMEAISDVALQNDGKILFVGSAYDSEKCSYAIVVGRNNADGTPDTSFGNNGITRVLMGKLPAAGRKLAIQQDGKIVVAGDVGKYESANYSHRSQRTPSDLVIFRLNSTGRIDRNFGPSQGKSVLMD